jgi:ABC-2 type transport system permease protein
MLGGSLTKLATSLLFLTVGAIEFRFIFGVQLAKGNPVLLLLILLLVIPSIYGLGIAFGSLVIRFREANSMVFLVRGIFMVFCGLTYPLEVLPGWMKGIASLLPPTYAVRAIRAVVLADATFADISADLGKLAIFAIALPILGYVSFYFTERRSRRTGALGQY